jgi:pimeloyl-ACP methyl ester carboxylesterase
MKLEIISRHPAGDERPTPLLFIHGMLHGAWCWDTHFLDWFADRGFAAYAVNLRGHGQSEGRDRLRWTRIADFVDDVASAVAQLPRPPVLIGHSMGGFIIQKYLERHDAPGAVLLSSPPPSGMLRAMLRVARRRPLLFTRIMATQRVQSLVATPALAREAFFSPDFPESALRQCWQLMQDESFRALLDMAWLDRPHPAAVKSPLLVLGAERDAMLSRDEIEATARAYHTSYEIIPGVAHNSMLEQRWESVAARILSWLIAGSHRDEHFDVLAEGGIR